jgi:hypothetical protein
MKARTFALATVALFGFALPQAAAAQIGIGIGGGPSFPTGEYGEDASAGWNVQATLGIGVPMLPFGLRADGFLNQFPSELEGNDRILGGTLNAELYFPSPMISPYFTGGVGMYNVDITHGNHRDQETALGFNAGLGVRFNLLAFGAFLETRAHHVNTDHESTQFIPITFGLRF